MKLEVRVTLDDGRVAHRERDFSQPALEQANTPGHRQVFLVGQQFLAEVVAEAFPDKAGLGPIEIA